MALKPALQFRDLGAHTPHRTLFDGLALSLPPGLSWLRGGDGSGKTTLLRLLAGAPQPPDITTRATLPAGLAVFWADPQSEALDNSTPTEAWAALAGPHPGFDAALATELAQALGLEPHWHKPLCALSTGSKRKVWLAAAFASGAALTLLDEPLAALDGAAARVVLDLLEDAADHPRRAFLVASHHPLDSLPLAGTVDLGGD